MSVARAGLVNALFSVGNSAANVLLVPLLLSTYGLGTYGALTLLVSVAQYFTALDLGLSAALVRHAVRVRSLGDLSYLSYRRTVVAFFVFGGLGLTTAAVATAQAWAPILHIEHIARLPFAVLSAGVLTVVTLVGNCYNSVLVAELRYARLNTYNLVRNLGPQLAALIAFRNGADLALALAYGALCSLGLLWAHVWLLTRHEMASPGGGLLLGRVELTQFVRETAGLSTQYSLDAMVLPVLQFVVGAKFNPEASGLVDVARRLLFAFRRMIEAGFLPLFARASQMTEWRDYRGLRQLAVKGTILTGVLCAAYFVVLKASLPWLLPAWLGSGATAVQPVALALLLGVTFTIPHIAVYQVFSASTKGRIVNTAASAASIGAVLLALFPGVSSLSGVLGAYAAGNLFGAVLTIAYARSAVLGRGADLAVASKESP